MANRSVVVNLLVRTGQFTAGMQRASNDMSSATTNMQTKTRALQMQIGLLGVGMVAFAAVAVAKWAEFDKAMSRVEATGGEAAKRIDELSEAAKSDQVIELGYSATEASNAIYELTKAGVSATDIIGGGMAGAMSLAAAETMDASESAAIMASALTQFNLTGADSSHVADLITAAAGKAQGSAHDLGFALKQSGLVANQFGLSIEEATGTLAFFASAGLIGSDAGTSLRTMLLHLAGPSTKAAKLMDEIGLEIYGANGEMVSMEQLADNLQSSMGKLSEEQRNQALATIFGADATRAASLLYREGGDAVAEWTDKVDDSGYAAEVARGRMDNLSGDMRKMSATFERSMIEMGESADAPLRKIVQGLTTLIDQFGDLDPAVQGIIMAITGGGGLAILAVLGIAQIVNALRSLQAGLVATGVLSQATAAKMATAFGVIAKSIGGVALIAAAATAAFVLIRGAADATKVSVDELAGAYDVAAGKFNNSAKQIAANKIVESFGWTKELQTGFGSIAEAAKALQVPLDDLALAMIGNEEAALRVKAVTDTLDLSDMEMAEGGEAADKMSESLDRLGLSVGKGKDAAHLLNEALGANGEVTDEAIQKAKDLAEAEGETGGATEDLGGQVEELDGMLQELGGSTAAVTAAEVAAQKAHEEYISSIVDSFTSFLGLGDVYQGVIDGQKEIATSAAESTESTKDSWEDFYDGVSVSADQYIAELTRQVEAQEAWAANLITLTERAKVELPANMQTAALEMIAELRNLGPEGAAQIALLKDMSAAELTAVVELYNRQGIATGQGWADGVEVAETPEVEVDTAAAQTSIDVLRAKLEGISLKTYQANVQIRIWGEERLAGIQRNMAAVAAGVGVKVPRPVATGGSIIGPGTGTSDSIPAMLSNGEHVLTASDVDKAGGQDAVYRLRNAIQTGMLKFATGGAVGGREKYMDYPDRLRLLAQIRSQEADLAKTGEDKVTGIERQVLVVDLNENRQKLRDAEDAARYGNADFWDAQVEAEQEAQRRAENLASGRVDYTREIQRGEFAEGMTGSLSSAYGSIDKVRNDVLPNLTGGAANALRATLDGAEIAARGLFTRLEQTDETLERMTEHAEELRGISDNVKDSLVGGFSLENVAQTAAVNPFTGEVTGGGAGSAGQGMLRSAQAYASKVKTFALRLKELAGRGFTGVILQEIAGMGAEAGIPAADALLGLNLADTKALNAAYADIATFGGSAGQAVTEGFFKGGVAAADGLVAGLEKQKGAVQDAIMSIAITMQDALKKALGIASPARKPRALMNFVGQGIALGLDDQKGVVADASARLGSAVMVGLGGGSYGFSGSAGGASGDLTATLSDEQVERLAVAFETGNVRNINAATKQKNQQARLTYGARGR